MTALKTCLAAGAALPLLFAAAASAQNSNANPRAQSVFEHWTPERIAAAEPRDMVIDHRGKAYIRGKKGKLKAHGHTDAPELTASTRQVRTPRIDEQQTQDNLAPTVTSRTPAANSTIGSSQTFSANVTDVDGVRSVVFEITFGGQVYTFDGVNTSGSTWSTTVEGFTSGQGSWRVIATDRVKRRGGNTGATSSFNFTVDAGTPPPPPPPGGGGIVQNARWANGGAIQTAAGRLFYEMPNGGGWSGYVCSGTAVEDGTTGRSVIITAAHCVYNDTAKAFARNVIFIPNQDGTTSGRTDRDCSNDPIGCWATAFGVVETNWTTSVFPANIPWDYAYYVVDDAGSHSGSGTGGALDAAAGTLSVDFSAPVVNDGQAGEGSQDWTHALGYSYSDDPFFMYSAEDMTTEGSDNWWLPSSQLSGGSSGGPWVQPMNEATGEGPLMSVNSWGYTTADGMAGPILSGTTAECLFEAAKTASLALANNADGSQGVVVDPANCDGGTPPPPPPPPPSGDLSASVTAFKSKGRKTWNYTWTGATTANVDIYLDGSRVATTANDGAYTLTGGKGGGSHTHTVCEAGSTTECAATVGTSF